MASFFMQNFDFFSFARICIKKASAIRYSRKKFLS
jgi:hypothetical protein